MSRRRLLLALLALHAAFNLIAAGSLHVSNSERPCPAGKGLVGDVCCDKCLPGTVVVHGETNPTNCTETNPTNCKNCIEGAEYMDHPNVNRECLRCGLCDTEHGWEVKENCTIYQNVKCMCKPGYFCSSEQCRHCDRCAKCEEEIVEECTQTKNTVCRSKKNLLWLIWLFISILIALMTAVLVWFCLRKRLKNEYVVPQHQDDEKCIEMKEHFPDIDLSPHISDIATEMTKEHVLSFVRKLGIQKGIIDAVIQDNIQNTTEQKIKLLQKWYEQNGMKGAHEKLITTLRQLKLRCTADTIEQKIKMCN